MVPGQCERRGERCSACETDFRTVPAASSISSKLSAVFSCDLYLRGSDFEAARQNGVANSLCLRMSNPSSDVRGGGEALQERLDTGRAGADQPQKLSGARAVSGGFQRVQFICPRVCNVVFHAS